MMPSDARWLSSVPREVAAIDWRPHQTGLDTDAERGSDMKPTARIELVVFDGVEELDALGPYEVFSVARQAGADTQVRLVTYNEVDRIRAAHGLVFHPQGRLDDGADVVVAVQPEEPVQLIRTGGAASPAPGSRGQPLPSSTAPPSSTTPPSPRPRSLPG